MVHEYEALQIINLSLKILRKDLLGRLRAIFIRNNVQRLPIVAK